MLLKRSRMHGWPQSMARKIAENCNGDLMKIATVLEAQLQRVACFMTGFVLFAGS